MDTAGAIAARSIEEQGKARFGTLVFWSLTPRRVSLELRMRVSIATAFPTSDTQH